MKLDVKRTLLILMALVLGLALSHGLSRAKNILEIVVFLAYTMAWVGLLSACWVHFDEVEEKNWRRAHGIE